MKRLFLALILFPCLVCCTEERLPDESAGIRQPFSDTADSGQRVFVKVNNAADVSVKSILGGDDIEEKITDITLAVYDRDGALRDRKYYSSDFSNMELSVLKGNSHDIFVLANVGDMTMSLPSHERDLPKFVCRVEPYSSLSGHGLPMCGALYNVVPSEKSVEVGLDRLFAKVSVRITHDSLRGTSSGSLFSYNLCNRSLYLRQANMKLFPFSSLGSRALSADDVIAESDYHADLNDRNGYVGSVPSSQLGPGPGYFRDTTLVFYVPENIQGKLLPENDDPYAKVPGNIASVGGRDLSGLCTYLEFNAKRENSGTGYSGGVTYRYYLGEDSTSDFSLRRNCHYRLTLDFTEEGFFVKSWKMDRNADWKDSRSLGFVKKSYVIYTGLTENVMVHYNASGSMFSDSQLKPDEWSYSFDEQEMARCGLSYSFDKDNLVKGENGCRDFCFRFSASPDACPGTSFPMRVRSWDGGLEDYATITIARLGDVNPQWDNVPMYVSQEGVLSVGGIPQEKLPVQVTGYDSNVVTLTRKGDAEFLVVANGCGQTTLKVSNSDGTQTADVGLDIRAPRLDLCRTSVVANPDGGTVAVEYRYLDGTGLPLKNVNSSVFNDRLVPVVSDAPSWLGQTSSGSEFEIHIRSLKDDFGNALVPGNRYGIKLRAKNCPEVTPCDGFVLVSNPFAGIRTSLDYGRIDDCSLFSLDGVSASLRSAVQGKVQPHGRIELEAPVPNAALSMVGAEIVPQWQSFSSECGSYSAQWKTSGGFSSGACFLISSISSGAGAHSAGKHDVRLTVTNRCSGEKLSYTCGTVEIYVHTAVGATASFGCRSGAYSGGGSGVTFSSVYGKLCPGNSPFTDRQTHIYYMDVTVDFLTPVDGVKVFSDMKTGVRRRQNVFDGMEIVRPSVSDGEQLNGSLLHSVMDGFVDERADVGGEPYGYRKGIGAMMYRAVLYPGGTSQINERTLESKMLGRGIGGLGNNAGYGPQYDVIGYDGKSDSPEGTVDRRRSFYFCPLSCREYVDEDGRGYHVLHFLEELCPESNGWTNLISD